MAAVRETFEETGILMALRSDGTPAAEELTAIPADAQARIEELEEELEAERLADDRQHVAGGGQRGGPVRHVHGPVRASA